MTTVQTAIKGFFEGGFGLRGTSRMIEMAGAFLKTCDATISSGRQFLAKVPSYNTVKNWVLQLGCYKLNRQKPQGNDWVYMLDKTIQMGPDKCLTIIGIRLSSLNKEDLTLSHKDIEPLVVKITRSCPGEVVREGLLEAKRKTGGYCQILSDGGSDLGRGIKLFDNMACHFYDITHKAALLIKAAFGKDSSWETFVKQATAMTQKIKLSPIAHLAPPELRAKSSTLNLGGFIRWGCKIWTFVANKERQESSEKKLIQEHCGWITDYFELLQMGVQIVQVADATKNLVHRHGYGQITEEKFKDMACSLTLHGHAKDFLIDLGCFVKQECNKVPAGEFRLGSTDVLESIFGKFKKFEGQFAEEGFTSLAGVLPGLIGATKEEEIREALVTYTAVEARQECCSEGSGGTYLARRRKDISEIGDKFNFNFYPLWEENKSAVGL